MANTVIRSLSVRLALNSAGFLKNINTVDKRMKRLSNGMRRQANMFSGQIAQMGLSLASAFGVREVAVAADAMTNLRNKLNAVYNSSEDVARGMMDIKRIAKESRTDLEAVGTLYQRLTVSTKSLKVAQEDIAAVTQVVANSFLLSGTTGSEAANSARQLAQGLASGALRGDEYRSVSENNAALTLMLAEGFGLTVGQLRLFAMTGGITAEKIIPMLTSRLEETNEAVEKMELTTAQARIRFKNAFTEMIDRLNSAYKIAPKVAAFIGVLSENVGVLTIAAGTLATVLISKLLVGFVAWIALGIKGAIVGLYGLISSVVLMTINVGLLAAGIMAKLVPALIAAAFNFAKVMAVPLLIVTGFTAIGLVVVALSRNVESLGTAWSNIMTFMLAKWNEFKAGLISGIANTKSTINSLLTSLGFDAIFDVDDDKLIALKNGLTQAAQESATAWEAVKGGVQGAALATGEELNRMMQSFKDTMSQDLGETFAPLTNLFSGGEEGEGGVMAGMSEKFGTAIDSIMEKIAESNPELARFMALLKGEIDPDAEEVKKADAKEEKPLTWAERFKNAVAVAKTAMKDLSKTAKAEVKTMIERYDTFEEVFAKGVENLKKHSAVRKAILLKEAIIEGKAAILKAWNSAPFPANLPGVAITTASVGYAIRDIMKGQAHDGMDSLPSTGTYMLERGERVVSSRANRDLTQFLADNRNTQSMQEPSNLTLEVNGVSDPDVVVAALSQRMNELQGMMRSLSQENVRAAFV